MIRLSAQEGLVGQRLTRAILAQGEEQPALVLQLADSGSDQARNVLGKWRQGGLYLRVSGDGQQVPFTLEGPANAQGKLRALRVEDGQQLVDRAPLFFAESELTPLETTSKLRKAIKSTLDVLTIADPDPNKRRAAVIKLGQEQKKEYLPLLEARLAKEGSAAVRKGLREAVAMIGLADADAAKRLQAVKNLESLNSISGKDLLAKAGTDKNAEVAAAAKRASKSLEDHIKLVDFFGTLFRGLSLGSVLLVVALGLAITFGLMGVINMAHGEMMVVGAYAVYMVQNLCGDGLFLPFFGLGVNMPGLRMGTFGAEYYFLVALPVAFFSAAAVGVLLERGIIRFLYRRPLESLLATWGVSLILQQVFRLLFGSNNVQVYSPSWLSGNFTVSDVILGWNRLVVIGSAVLIVALTWLLLTKTPLGLLIRAVMQNREMASCMGVRTDRVNMLTFGLGSGLAGLAGAFLSQIGNVGPSLGQSWIVDCFMTVVVGGVGNMVGTVCSALAIGVFDQSVQQILLNPVLGKITVLVAIIFFLQWKPGGLFPTRSRSLES